MCIQFTRTGGHCHRRPNSPAWSSLTAGVCVRVRVCVCGVCACGRARAQHTQHTRTRMHGYTRDTRLCVHICMDVRVIHACVYAGGHAWPTTRRTRPASRIPTPGGFGHLRCIIVYSCIAREAAQRGVFVTNYASLMFLRVLDVPVYTCICTERCATGCVYSQPLPGATAVSLMFLTDFILIISALISSGCRGTCATEATAASTCTAQLSP